MIPWRATKCLGKSNTLLYSQSSAGPKVESFDDIHISGVISSTYVASCGLVLIEIAQNMLNSERRGLNEIAIIK